MPPETKAKCVLLRTSVSEALLAYEYRSHPEVLSSPPQRARRMSGFVARMIYLGKHGTSASREAYGRTIAEFAASPSNATIKPPATTAI